ncbi:superoxide dismutase family protein [Streptomyces sp. CA-294286]|uniref:superoxide dismutase family protein n=1 Tax=Streptomyces sp. CA-294286 TaxID=3240070 RepID=UPI003D943067
MAGRNPWQKRVRTGPLRPVALATAALLAGTLVTAGPASAGDLVGGRGGDGTGLTVGGRFAPASAGRTPAAVTYEPRLVPVGGWIRIQQKVDRRGTTVAVRVKGLAPGHAFGMHVHEKPCGADPEAAGKHYQHVKDPRQVNAHNEVWLDFTTDRSGSAEASAHHAWGLPAGAAGSVVLHREQGGAGERVGCFTVPFGRFRTGVG